MTSNSCRCPDLRGHGSRPGRKSNIGAGREMFPNSDCGNSLLIQLFSPSSASGYPQNPACPGAHSPGPAAWTTCPFLHSPKSTDARKPQKRSTKRKLTHQTLREACRHFLSEQGPAPKAGFGAVGSEDWNSLLYSGEGASWLQRL